MMRLQKYLSEEHGSTILEFTFTSMILLALTFAMVDFGRYIYASNVVSSAAQAGARAGIINENIGSAITSHLIALDVDRATHTVSPDAATATTGTIIEIEVTYEFEFITPFISASVGNPIQITASTSMLKF